MSDLKKFIATTIREYLNEQSNVLLAPNGKPSNLPKNLYEYVRTDEFKKWFGDWEKSPNNTSKVVDENGEPMLVFHGTNKKFTEFRAGYHKDRYFFTNDEELSKSYGSVNLEVFLNIRKPFKTSSNVEFTNMFDKGDVDENYDGVFYNSKTERGEPINAIICFNSNQIKITNS
jgi:hypothetical protein